MPMGSVIRCARPRSVPADDMASGSARLPRASVAETLRVGLTVLAPILAQGVIRRRPGMVALAERFDADRRAGRVLHRLRDRYGPGPVLLRVPGRRVALVLSPDHVHRVL